jgi:hypothetical protein
MDLKETPIISLYPRKEHQPLQHLQTSCVSSSHIERPLLVFPRSNDSPHKCRNDFKIIDSTTIGLCLQKYKWADFRKTKAGIKVHLRLVFVDQDDVVPEKAVMTPARKSDRIDETGATYVFDRGYMDYPPSIDTVIKAFFRQKAEEKCCHSPDSCL